MKTALILIAILITTSFAVTMYHLTEKPCGYHEDMYGIYTYVAWKKSPQQQIIEITKVSPKEAVFYVQKGYCVVKAQNEIKALNKVKEKLMEDRRPKMTPEQRKRLEELRAREAAEQAELKATEAATPKTMLNEKQLALLAQFEAENAKDKLNESKIEEINPTCIIKNGGCEIKTNKINCKISGIKYEGDESYSYSLRCSDPGYYWIEFISKDEYRFSSYKETGKNIMNVDDKSFIPYKIRIEKDKKD